MSKNIVLGLWDTDKAGKGLGSLLIFQQELLLAEKCQKADGIDLVYSSSDFRSPMIYYSEISQFNPSVRSVCFLKNGDDYIKTKRDAGTYIWPTDERYPYFSNSESTLAVQQMWNVYGKLVPMTPPEQLICRAQKWLSSFACGSIVIAVHLKKLPEKAQSNADLKSWLCFFRTCKDLYKGAKFVLIGDDEYDAIFDNCENVIITKTHGGGLSLDLAIVQLSSFFMGMSSGPCNIAILSSLPYAIWKDPDHHAEQMRRELGTNGQFPFANKHQRFLYQQHTVDSLLAEFYRLYTIHHKEVP